MRLDADLATGLAARERERAERSCLAPVVELPKGAWDADATPGVDRSGLGLLVLSGAICRRVVQNQRYGAELVGPGDLLRPWDRIGEWSSIPTGSDWLVVKRTRLAVLDAEFARSSAAFPEIAAAMVRRALMRSRYLAILIAIVSQRRVETRLLMLFWHLADRFGHMHDGWVDVPVPLTHSLLGELVAARRPSVSTALSRLDARGVLRRTPHGWHLHGPVPEEFEDLRCGGGTQENADAG